MCDKGAAGKEQDNNSGACGVCRKRERYRKCKKEIICSSEYIIEANQPNTAVIKKISDDNEQFKTVLRIETSLDNQNIKIAFMKKNEIDY